MNATATIVLLASLALACGCSYQTGSSLARMERGERARTLVLLAEHGWDSLTVACGRADGYQLDGCQLDTQQRGALTKYSYFDLHRDLRVDVTDYRGYVMAYRQQSVDVIIAYFDRPAWTEHVGVELGSGADRFRLDTAETDDILIAYYRLLGLEPNEYGWICNYSPLERMPDQRVAVLALIKTDRRDLLRRLLDSPSNEGRAYAADALIYLDHQRRIERNTLRAQLARVIESASEDSLAAHEAVTGAHWINTQLELVESMMLSDDDHRRIDRIRTSGGVVKTCSSHGSNNVQLVPVAQLLSDSAIAQIPGEYEKLKASSHYWMDVAP